MKRHAWLLWAQGAAEIVLRRCTAAYNESGVVVPLDADARAALEAVVTDMASTGLRTLCMTVRDLDEAWLDAVQQAGLSPALEEPPDEQLTLCCILGIKVWCMCLMLRRGAWCCLALHSAALCSASGSMDCDAHS